MDITQINVTYLALQSHLMYPHHPCAQESEAKTESEKSVCWTGHNDVHSDKC